MHVHALVCMYIWYMYITVCRFEFRIHIDTVVNLHSYSIDCTIYV